MLRSPRCPTSSGARPFGEQVTSSSATEVFEAERSRLVQVAYRMLGTPDDAEDVVQEAWLRWHRTPFESIENPAAWLTTVTTRLSIDRLTSARQRREVYVGPWLPEPITVEPIASNGALVFHDPSWLDPATTAVENESLHLGLLRVLETLGPVERAVFLLHDVFGYPFEQISTIIDRTTPATRQIAKRARERVRSGRPRVDAEPPDMDAWSAVFLGAIGGGDVRGLESMLADDVVHVSDGGAERRAARRPVIGADRVARLLINLATRSLQTGDGLHWVRINGQIGLYIVRADQPVLLTVVGWHDGEVTELLAIVNPAKLSPRSCTLAGQRHLTTSVRRRRDLWRCLWVGVVVWVMETRRATVVTVDEDTYETYAAELTRYAAAIAGPIDADDIVAEAFVSVLSSPKWATIDDRRAYLYRVVLNQVRDRHRARSRRERRELAAREESAAADLASGGRRRGCAARCRSGGARGCTSRRTARSVGGRG